MFSLTNQKLERMKMRYPDVPQPVSNRRPGLPELAEQLDKEVANVADQIEALQAGMVPFLRPAAPANPATEGSAPFCGSPLECQLATATSRLGYLSAELLDLRNRLAV